MVGKTLLLLSWQITYFFHLYSVFSFELVKKIVFCVCYCIILPKFLSGSENTNKNEKNILVKINDNYFSPILNEIPRNNEDIQTDIIQDAWSS